MGCHYKDSISNPGTVFSNFKVSQTNEQTHNIINYNVVLGVIQDIVKIFEVKQNNKFH